MIFCNHLRLLITDRYYESFRQFKKASSLDIMKVPELLEICVLNPFCILCFGKNTNKPFFIESEVHPKLMNERLKTEKMRNLLQKLMMFMNKMRNLFFTNFLSWMNRQSPPCLPFHVKTLVLNMHPFTKMAHHP